MLEMNPMRFEALLSLWGCLQLFCLTSANCPLMDGHPKGLKTPLCHRPLLWIDKNKSRRLFCSLSLPCWSLKLLTLY